MNYQKTESKQPSEKLAKFVDAMKEMVDTIVSLGEKAEISAELLDALEGMVDMFDAVVDKIYWEDLDLDSETRRAINVAPVTARAAIRRGKNVFGKK